ncbi:hypothetical protein A5733_04360 [Mycobacterium sp. NS-7484]|uniref:hypothetical protein n=1 Tax=Mycobacterium sp. NS-7484 TaxID=1834161 RepID=UPI00096E8192|nr:hypothetical protein [Mycobacterium sp. NS-7484]OMC00350.1 hypothetical protein A5733_04360 [Mycobacterium sp. NS-7484]
MSTLDEPAHVAAEMSKAIEHYAEMMRGFGITIRQSSRPVSIDIMRKRATIGHVVVHDDGVVEAVARADTTIGQRAEVVRQAQQARIAAIDPGCGWIQGRGGWATIICEPL